MLRIDPPAQHRIRLAQPFHTACVDILGNQVWRKIKMHPARNMLPVEQSEAIIVEYILRMIFRILPWLFTCHFVL